MPKNEKIYKIYDPEFEDNSVVIEKPGQEVKLKGYSKFRFVAVKLAKIWDVYEYTTGAKLTECTATTLVEAKKQAREYLNKNCNMDAKVLQEKINEWPVLNSD